MGADPLLHLPRPHSLPSPRPLPRTMTSELRSALANLYTLCDMRSGMRDERSTFLRDSGNPSNDDNTLSTGSSDDQAMNDEKPTSPRRAWIRCFARMTRRDWLNFAVIAMASFNDWFDLYIVSVAIWKLATYYRTTFTNVSSALTFSLLARAAGALMFGAAASSTSSTLTRRWGQRVTLSLTCLAMAGVHITSIHMTSVDTFFLTRGVMGMEIGSMWGSVAHDVVKRCPAEAQPVLYTLLDVISSLAFIVAALVNWQIGGKAATWKTLFWVAAGLSVATALARMAVHEQHNPTAPPSTTLQVDPAERLSLRARMHRYFQRSAVSSRRALRLGWTMVRTEWRTMAYMTTFAALQACAQNTLVLTYMAFLRRGKMLNNGRASVVCIVARCGAIAGSIVGAACVAQLGVRRTLVAFGLLTCFLTPAAMLPDAIVRLCVGGFFVHFALFAALAAVPSYFRAIALSPYANIMPLVVYHAGALLAAPATQLTILLTSHFNTHVIMRGTAYIVPAYTTFMAILISSFCLAWALWTAVGPDQRKDAEESRVVQDSDVQPTPRHSDLESSLPQLSPHRPFTPLRPTPYSPTPARLHYTNEIIAAPAPARALDNA